MADLSHWDWAEEFNLWEAAALIDGQEPSTHPVSPHRIRPIAERLFDALLPALWAREKGTSIPETALSFIGAGRKMPKGIIKNFIDATLSDEFKVSRAEIARWISLVGLKSVYQFDLSPAATGTPPVESQIDISNSASADLWPWGNHHTELLGHLDAAARNFWVGYDPANAKGTAPKNETVIDWLKTEREVTDKMAQAIATMLRPDGLPTGPRK